MQKKGSIGKRREEGALPERKPAGRKDDKYLLYKI